MSTESYTVTGMTCSHCVRSVQEEVSDLPGVESVSVDLPSGRLEVTSDAPLGVDVVRSAVEEAGYELVPVTGSSS